MGCEGNTHIRQESLPCEVLADKANLPLGCRAIMSPSREVTELARTLGAITPGMVLSDLGISLPEKVNYRGAGDEQ